MIRLVSKPVILQANESMNLIVQIQPLQIGYHEILLRIQNETNLADRIDITFLTVRNNWMNSFLDETSIVFEYATIALVHSYLNKMIRFYHFLTFLLIQSISTSNH